MKEVSCTFFFRGDGIFFLCLLWGIRSTVCYNEFTDIGDRDPNTKFVENMTLGAIVRSLCYRIRVNGKVRVVTSGS